MESFDANQQVKLTLPPFLNNRKEEAVSVDMFVILLSYSNNFNMLT